MRSASAFWGAFGLALTLLGAAPAGAAGDREAGSAKATQCQTCHGRQGMATMPGVPNLAGQSDVYLTAQLKAFREGVRNNEQMSIIAKSLSDADIENLAAYFSQIKVTVGSD
ncbi:c-type cytochrome [Azospirillum canadense]|uniref:c-type cytochrome n=1 Tax=Azospirillum canadense TaxID=403962 RepID=UPI0022277306|nr:cytochrome c [Azospirillum canadense]MCW2239898.1 cytochrome c553 [Azospirillum canadense]